MLQRRRDTRKLLRVARMLRELDAMSTGRGHVQRRPITRRVGFSRL